VTTVIYSTRHRLMVGDMFVWPEGGFVPKVVKNKFGDIAGGAGALALVQRWFRAFLSVTRESYSFDDFPTLNSMCSGDSSNGTILLVKKATGVTWYFDNDSWFTFEAPYYAIGSGKDFALGALSAGLHPRKVIPLVSNLDPGTGPHWKALKLSSKAHS